MIGFANMGLTCKPVPLGKDQEGKDLERTVAEIIEDLHLEVFLNETGETQ